MIDTDLTVELRTLLSRHGEVKSITPLPNIKHKETCTLLVTMHSTNDAFTVQRVYGFTLFGFNSLIIQESWLRQNLNRN